jgi:hypothetical protein
MTTTKRYSRTPNPYELLAAELRQRGVATSAERLEDQSAALRDRRRLDEKADIDNVRNLAIAAKRARRGLEVATTIWQLSPTSSNRQALAQATAARREAMATLREELCNDDDMVSAAIRWVS